MWGSRSEWLLGHHGHLAAGGAAADHDPCSNYGNWTYVAGVGADPRQDRYFLMPKQSKQYDKEGTTASGCELLYGSSRSFLFR